MSKRLLSTALVAVLAAAGFAPSAQAATGTINISGKVLADTCTIAVNGGSTVTLPSVMKTSFTAVGSVAGATTFAVALTGCDTNATSATMQFSGSGIDTTTGNLKNTAAGGSQRLMAAWTVAQLAERLAAMARRSRRTRGSAASASRRPRRGAASPCVKP